MIAHGKGDLRLAEQEYKSALADSTDNLDPRLYQNYGALLRSLERFGEAEKIYLAGIKIFPNNWSINLNAANLYRDISKPASAIYHYLQSFLAYCSKGSFSGNEETFTPLHSIVVVLRELGCTSWALQILKSAFKFNNSNPGLLINLILVLDAEIDTSPRGEISQLIKDLQGLVHSEIVNIPQVDQVHVYFGLASHELTKSNSTLAHDYFQRAFDVVSKLSTHEPETVEKLKKDIMINGWNLGCLLLKEQDLIRGWDLFENGLQTPAPGPQRWQRALPKPFNFNQIELWRGQSLAGKNLLLLEEQAIGDAMMFLSLLTRLLTEAKSISVLLPDRLIPIYKRSLKDHIDQGVCSVVSHSDVTSGQVQPENFDYQSPMGSICKHRFQTISDYSPCVPCLSPLRSHVSELREQYLRNSTPDTKLIGISWRGGGKPDRIKRKSVEEDEFLKLLSGFNNYRFVSLQYGECKDTLHRWAKSGLPLVHDQRINPLQNMEKWLDQVAVCDAVISVANTTIHGAGGLGIPTMCLLSKHADWRWFSDPEILRSYWYPSVGIAREHDTNGWSDAYTIVRHWLHEGCPPPTGPISAMP